MWNAIVVPGFTRSLLLGRGLGGLGDLADGLTTGECLGSGLVGTIVLGIDLDLDLLFAGSLAVDLLAGFLGHSLSSLFLGSCLSSVALGGLGSSRLFLAFRANLDFSGLVLPAFLEGSVVSVPLGEIGLTGSNELILIASIADDGDNGASDHFISPDL